MWCDLLHPKTFKLFIVEDETTKHPSAWTVYIVAPTSNSQEVQTQLKHIQLGSRVILQIPLLLIHTEIWFCWKSTASSTRKQFGWHSAEQGSHTPSDDIHIGWMSPLLMSFCCRSCGWCCRNTTGMLRMLCRFYKCSQTQVWTQQLPPFHWPHMFMCTFNFHVHWFWFRLKSFFLFFPVVR